MQPLRAADATWLNMDREDNPLVIDALLLLQPGADVSAVVRRFIEQVVVPYPRFRQVVVDTPGLVRSAAWKPVELDLSHHVSRVRLPAPASRDVLWSAVGAQLERRLDPERPLWSLTVIEGLESRQAALLFRAHHVIGDGMAMAQLLLSVCDEDEISMPRPRGRTGRATGDWTERIMADIDTSLDLFRAATELLAIAPDPPSPLSGPLGGKKRIAWSNPVPLSHVQAVREHLGGTVNDVLVSTVAGALRRAVDHPDLPDVHALIPVYLRPQHAPLPKDLGNHFAPVFLRLPCCEPGPVARHARVMQRTHALKRGQMPLVAAMGVRAIGVAPRRVETVAINHFASRASLVLTNVPGPYNAVHIAGARIDDIIFFVPQPASIGVGLSLFSYDGRVRLGVSVDVERDVDPAAVARAFGEAFAALLSQANVVETPILADASQSDSEPG